MATSIWDSPSPYESTEPPDICSGCWSPTCESCLECGAPECSATCGTCDSCAVCCQCEPVAECNECQEQYLDDGFGFCSASCAELNNERARADAMEDDDG